MRWLGGASPAPTNEDDQRYMCSFTGAEPRTTARRTDPSAGLRVNRRSERRFTVRGRNIAVGCGCKLLEMSELILVLGDGNVFWSSFLPAH